MTSRRLIIKRNLKDYRKLIAEKLKKTEVEEMKQSKSQEREQIIALNQGNKKRLQNKLTQHPFYRKQVTTHPEKVLIEPKIEPDTSVYLDSASCCLFEVPQSEISWSTSNFDRNVKNDCVDIIFDRKHSSNKITSYKLSNTELH